MTEKMILDAVHAGVGEAEDLDWKAAVDEIKDPKEFAKDVAAMANTLGGIIVFGVREDGAEHASELVGVANPQSQVQSLRGRAAMVRPFVPALRVYSVPLSQPDLAGTHVIVVEVPRSAEAPHLVPQTKESWGLPRRRGSDTDWLGESDLESAYAARFQRRRSAEEQLAELADQLLSDRLLHTDTSIWVTVSASCSMPSTVTTSRVVDGTRTEPSMLAALDLLPEGNMLRDVFTIASPRAGLRRAVVSTDIPYTGTSTRGHIELLHDGSFVGALNAGFAEPVDGTHFVVQARLESAVRDLLTVAVLHADRRHADGILQVRVSVALSDRLPSAQLALTNQRYTRETPQPVPNSITLRRIVPVTAETPLADLVSTARAREQLVRQLALDLVHQFAVTSLTALSTTTG
ncbi:helix-turn-helix domain-containing protein [Kitasatospora sp. GAS1066B]|uniref:AlbA family DNA-binding domain-containing protein n=1 Tax=Kitasatospora sp. GAS1066B TaxID=3156271 RepID=UPI003519D571